MKSEIKIDVGHDGKPIDKGYLECDLPEFLQRSLDQMKKAWELIDAGKEYSLWDCDWCELQSDINAAEVDQQISSEKANYLRKKYLRMVNDND